ncbi:putative secreted protein (Por secretion system target) [Kordia periserrulae]|uniref:Putative secreted protein (Por secretion system target) n=1 Tax=Kordia periserrulae TaxID=701523 RepID=A0A2T6BY94_9FLAO|nr:T9SS type A sorting domain-containing protein [Kordia periserrulae]PTX61040.1 putative secreted protein (Por secretion system target) [Kordia periserrulae]
MKNFTLFVLLAFIFQVSAQNSQQLEPESWSIPSIDNVTPIQLPKPNLAPLKAEDAVNDLDKSKPWRFGYDHFVSFGLENAGQWHELPNGDRIWRINIISPKALTMNVLFERYKIPIGGKVYIYNDDRSEVLNPYTHLHNNPEEILGTWMVAGESLWIEYFEPAKVRGQGKLEIGNVIHGYRTLTFEDTPGKALNDSGPCNVDVNCDISAFNSTAHDIKEDLKKSVAMIVVSGNGFCTGALVNNTNNDGTPYFLTANHCLGGSVAGWAFRFNWASDESVADCATNAPSINNSFIQTASGSILRAFNSKSDMALLEITDAAFFTNNSANLVWAGWNRSTSAVPSLNVGVHHPSGDIQKVCVDLQGATRQTTTFNGNPAAEMWRIADWDLGVTEPGSSGSPLFDQDGYIIGKLSGGTAACSGTNDNGGYDIYGRFGVSWDFGTTNASQLKFWLDPAGTNPITLGQFPPAQTFDTDAAVSVLNIPNDLCENTITPTIRITNAGNLQLTSATITHQLDTDTPVVINWTGSLALDEFEDIVLSPIAVTGEGAHSFTATVSNPNGGTDESLTNDTNVKNFSIPQGFEVTTIRVIITPDRYGAETTWTLEDSNGMIIGSGGPYTTIGTNTTQPDEIQDVAITTLNECYTFTLNDSYGDGICCLYGAGTYRLEDGSGNILINGSGSFTSSVSNLFKVTEPLSVGENALESNLRIYPNPSAADFTVNIRNYANVTYEIKSVTGQRIKAGNFNEGDNTLSMRGQAAGLYFIRITDTENNISVTKKIIRY